ncbi:general substrate transporter [Periconia macrospinosa]|uniref:General substrate transporter n=1 Tax=Periconia macrospinosa TaxID=97972 RepID=A0A2V1DP13_9PLEO|nr:general substrate transporter [Periconia macrospinosa]
MPEKAPPPKTFWGKLGHSLGDLPEWSVGGNKLSGKRLNFYIGFIASNGFLMFGYDQGVLSALITLPSWQRVFPTMTPRELNNPLCWIDGDNTNGPDLNQCTGDANMQAFAVAIYQIGCFLGAVVILFNGEKWGRKPSTFWGSFVMIIGTIMQAAANGYALLCVGRIVGGVGNGMVTSTIPTWQSECARPEKRGVMIILAGAVISGGVMIAYWVDYAFYFTSGSVQWRFPVAFQSFFTIIVMIGLLFLPDSPRWLAMKGRTDEAHDVLARLFGKEMDDPEVLEELNNIQESLYIQSRGGGFRYRELFTNGPSQNFRRTFLGALSQFCQQFCGINLVTYYATYVFENSLGFDANLSRLISACNGTEYFMASLLAIPAIERFGRRGLMFLGAAGMSAAMAVLAGVVSTGTIDEVTGAPVLEDRFGITAVVMLFVFNSFFGIGWLGMSWLLPAELTNLRTRIHANAVSTCSNWLSNFVIVMIAPPAFTNLTWRTYIIFAVLNAAIIPTVYFLFPEPKGRSLEEMDVIFASAWADSVSPVKRAKEMPKLTGSQVEAELAKYFGEEEAHMRRRSSAVTTAN